MPPEFLFYLRGSRVSKACACFPEPSVASVPLITSAIWTNGKKSIPAWSRCVGSKLLSLPPSRNDGEVMASSLTEHQTRCTCLCWGLHMRILYGYPRRGPSIFIFQCEEAVAWKKAFNFPPAPELITHDFWLQSFVNFSSYHWFFSPLWATTMHSKTTVLITSVGALQMWAEYLFIQGVQDSGNTAFNH